MEMAIIAIVTGLALIEYMTFSLRVGMARGKYGVEAPATSGDDIFERHYRVQQNTLEQLIVFLPSLWLFAQFVSINVAAGLGLVFIAGRAFYAVSYVADPKKRTAGFLIGYLANAALILGSIGGAVRAML
jgi:uncharacterized membrane protein YecN with MAPEG domain